MNKILYILIFLIVISADQAFGQQAEIIKSLRIHTAEEYGVEIYERNIIQNSNGDYYAILSSYYGDIYIDDNIYTNDSLPDGYASESDYDNLILLVKINKDLELQKVLKIKNIKYPALKMTASDKHVFLAFEQRKHVQIGDEILPHSQIGKKQTILSLDADLLNMEEIKIPNLNTYIGELAISDNYLYIGAKLEADYQKFEYGNSTLSNYHYINQNTQDTTYGGSTPFVVKYDISNRSVIKAWKFGGLGQEYVNRMQIDQEGNIVINGLANTLKWVTFDGVDSIYVKSYDTAYLVKFNPEGEVVFGNLFTEWNSANIVHVYLEGDDTYIASSFKGEFMQANGVDIINQGLDGSVASHTYFTCKIDGSGDIIWVHSLNPKTQKNRIVNIIGSEENIIISAELSEDSKVNILGETFTTDTKLNLLYTLDKDSGNILSYAVSHANHMDVVLNCLAQSTDQKISMLYQTVSEHNLWGNDFDTWYIGGFFDTRSIDQYFLKLDFSFLTSTNNFESSNSLMKISPNPVVRDGAIKVILTDVKNGSWSLYSSIGEVVKNGTFRHAKEHNIDFVNLLSGQYILHYNDGEKMQNEIVIII